MPALTKSLDKLAEQINGHHNLIGRARRTALVEAEKAGRLLIEARELATGPWSQWLTENVPNLPLRTAQVYERIANNWEWLQDLQPAVESIRGAVKLLSAPEKESPPPDEPEDPPERAARCASGDDEFDDPPADTPLDPDRGPDVDSEPLEGIDPELGEDDVPDVCETPAAVEMWFLDAIKAEVIQKACHSKLHRELAGWLRKLADDVERMEG